MTNLRLSTEMLLKAGELLLEYNESTGEIHRALATTARSLTHETCHIAVAYGSITISLAGESPVLRSVRELRYNTTIQARVHAILAQLRQGTIEPAAALAQLEVVAVNTPHYPRWLAALLLGAGAASLAVLLGADGGGALVAGGAAALGLLARQALGRRQSNLLVLPLTAAFIGALLGGLAIRLGWTQTTELVLLVPALMLVPGPHLINGLLDLIDNFVPMSLARIGLAVSILLASAAGIILGVELTLTDPIGPQQAAGAVSLNLATDMMLAGIVTAGFAIFYNTALQPLWIATLGGMAGHGLRFLALEAGCRLEAATFLGGLAVGVFAGCMARYYKLPMAVVAFAGAVTMVPGLHIYRAFGGALQLVRLGESADPKIVAEMLGNALHACVVVCGLALGLILGARGVLAVTDGQDSSAAPGTDERRVMAALQGGRDPIEARR